MYRKEDDRAQIGGCQNDAAYTAEATGQAHRCEYSNSNGP